MEKMTNTPLNSESILIEHHPDRNVYYDRTGILTLYNAGKGLEQEIEPIIIQEKMVRHENLVKYTTIEKYHAEFYLVREETRAKELFQWKPADIEDTCRILLKILEIMQAFHQNGVPLKGVSRGQLKQDQDGMFLLQDPLVTNRLGKMLASPYRVDSPPEVIKGQNWNEASDVFSWGVLAYQLLCGQDPFQANAEYDRIQEILRADIAFLKDREPRLNDDLCRMVMTCFQKQPGKRPTVNGLIEQLTNLIQTGAYQVDDQAAEEYTAKANQNIKRYQRMEHFKHWFRRFGIITGVAIVAILVFFFITRPKTVITVHTSPQEVVNYYYHGIETLKPELMSETLYWVKEQNTLQREITQLRVYLDMEIFINIAFTELKVEPITKNKTKARFNVNYNLWFQYGKNERNIQRSEVLTLRPIHKIWRITDIQIRKEKR